MLDNADSDSPAFDPPDPERVYHNDVAQCRRMGVTPTPRDRAKALIRGWVDALVSRRAPPAEH